MQIFAHRGLKIKHPENTMPAFCSAFLSGFGIELDIRLTQDKKFICMHNSSTLNMTGVDLTIKKSTYQKLSKLKIKNSILHIPLFSEVIEQALVCVRQEQKIAIHLKYEEQNQEQIDILLGLFEEYDLYKQALIFDLTFETARQIRNKNSLIEIAISVGEANYSPTIYTWQEAREHKELFDVVWWDEWKIPGGAYNGKRANEIHNVGKSIYVISPELHQDHGHPFANAYNEYWLKFLQWGIDGVCTAYPSEFRQIYNDITILK
jgi:glycerophosphoryl diester phosphodiesterase